MKSAFDTNILVRLIVNDDPQRAARAVEFIKRQDAKNIFVCYGVVLETFYVLKKVYGLSQADILAKIQDLLRIEQFYFEQEIPLRLALAKSAKGMGFYDALIGEIGVTRAVKTYTFDKDLKKDKNFLLLS
jgi:predicted nucleic-acid-binding protein